MQSRSALVLLAITAGAVLPSGVAVASTVSMDGTTAVFKSGQRASAVTTDSRTQVTGSEFSDAFQPLLAGTGCVAGSPVVCPSAVAVDIRLGRGDDRVRSWNLHSLRVTGADGDDDIDASGGDTTVLAGGGDDKVVMSSNGGGSVSGGEGDDHVRSQFGTQAVLNGDDGDDLIAGTVAINTVNGGRGDDALFGLGFGAGSLAGSSGDDTILVRGTFAGGYEISGGTGDDTIVGGPGLDAVRGESGDDRIDVSGDGVADTVDCGSGADRVYADPEDVVSRSCERRISGPLSSGRIDAALARLAKAFPDLAS